MATRQKIGMIMKAGPGYEARPLGQPAQPCKDDGEARSFFRRFAGNGPQTGFAQGIGPSKMSVVFVPDPARPGIEDVYLHIP